jgi:hypothetical protein
MTAAEPLRVVYAGRRRIAAPGDAVVLDEWEVLPGDLLPLLATAGSLVVADADSFPWDALRHADRDIPLAVMLPDAPAAEVEALLGRVCLDHLGPWDAVTAGDGLWAALRAGRRWPSTLRTDAGAVHRRLAGITRASKHRWRRFHGAVWAEILRRDIPLVLDVGGVLAGWVGKAGYAAVAGDDVERRLVAAVPEADTVGWDGLRLQLEDGTVDLVAVPGVADADRPGAPPPSEWWRVLAPGGAIVVEVEADPAVPGSGPRRVAEAVAASAPSAPPVPAAATYRLPGEQVHRLGILVFRRSAA